MKCLVAVHALMVLVDMDIWSGLFCFRPEMTRNDHKEETVVKLINVTPFGLVTHLDIIATLRYSCYIILHLRYGIIVFHCI
jgi:hypothetical protein